MCLELSWIYFCNVMLKRACWKWFFWHFFSAFNLILLKLRIWEVERMSVGFPPHPLFPHPPPCTGSFPRCLQWARLDLEPEPVAKKFNSDYPRRWQGPNFLSYDLLPRVCIDETLESGTGVGYWTQALP